MQPSEQIIQNAIDLIEERGWIKEHYSSPNGYCAVGAIREAWRNFMPEQYSTDFRLLKEAVGKVLQELPPDVLESNSPYTADHGILAKWNDMGSTSKEDVIALFRKAAGNSNE